MADRVTTVRDDSPAASIVRLHGVNKWYDGFHVLRDIDLVVAPGERVVLWGPSGSGKTTLLRCLAGLEPAQAGTMEIAGVRKVAAPLARPQPTAGVGLVFQSSSLFLNLRVLDNLTIGLRFVRKLPKREAEAIAMGNLAKLRMGEFAHRFPRQLSGGQQQRAEIARALCMDPQVLLFDEPTSALDPEMITEVLDVMVGLADEGMTMMVVTHEMAFARRVADRILFMDAGRIVEDRDVDAFFTEPHTERAREFLSKILHHAGDAVV